MSAIDNLNIWIGKTVSWLSVALVLVIILDVCLRYLFSVTSAASFELEWHLFAALFLLGSAYTLQQDRHVRVDVFYTRFSVKQKAWVNLIGSLFLLLPFCAVATWESLSFVASSYSFGESSPQPGGLPYRWLIKSSIPLGLGLLGLQGVSEILKSALIICKK